MAWAQRGWRRRAADPRPLFRLTDVCRGRSKARASDVGVTMNTWSDVGPATSRSTPLRREALPAGPVPRLARPVAVAIALLAVAVAILLVGTGCESGRPGPRGLGGMGRGPVSTQDADAVVRKALK